MLIVNNTPPLCGDAWLQTVLTRLVQGEPLPAHWRRQDWVNPSIAAEQLEDFFASADFRAGRYVIKAHYLPDVAPTLDRDDVAVIALTRDGPDLALARYESEPKSTRPSLSEWMQRYGAPFVRAVADAEEDWRGVALAISYDQAVREPHIVLRRIAAHLEIELTAVRAASILKATTKLEPGLSARTVLPASVYRIVHDAAYPPEEVEPALGASLITAPSETKKRWSFF